MDIAIIPAYNPDMKLVELTVNLYEKGIENIIVVNDGSEKQAQKIFGKLGKYVKVINHELNKGKGAAIKTALKIISEKKHDVEGIVILDADGQHRPEDALYLLSELRNDKRGLILGTRSFDGKVPFGSLFGNIVTKYVFRICSGVWVSDTQTGLRAFSSDMISYLLSINGERYEYETNVLLNCAKNNIPIIEVPIKTIYHDEKNSCSHFRVVRDSVRIYGNLLAFSGASFLSFLVDYLLFFPLVWLFGFVFKNEEMGLALVYGNIAARLLSAAFNYYLNSTYVFSCKQKRYKSILSYVILACVILVLNTVILYCLHDFLGIEKAIAKLITELLLFIISFTVQKFLIFNKN